MKRSILLWQIGGFVFSTALGTVFHFLYDWTSLKFVTLFSAVNESTFEHMKILFFPLVLYTIFQSFFFNKLYKDYWLIKSIGIVVGTTLIPILFYTLTGCLGVLPACVNILIFFTSAGVGFLIEAILFKKNNNYNVNRIFPIILILLLCVCYLYFTLNPLRLPLFLDPVTKSYRIAK